jgi:predicted nucleotidyltransferase component of viral defense system
VKDHLLQLVQSAPLEARRNRAREYVQLYLLRLLHEGAATTQLCFVGGTALRVLHALPRFSEDLDFSLAEGVKGFAAQDLFARLARDLERSGYDVTLKPRHDRAVANAFFRFAALPRELGWTTDPRAALSVKVEIDCNPPTGARSETTLIQRFFPIALRHHDLPSLFAGKLHALITRPYAKGRDWFDLVWYLTEKRGLAPNVKLLQSALEQTGHAAVTDWRDAVRRRLRTVAWREVLADLRPFVERPGDLRQITPALVEKLLG